MPTAPNYGLLGLAQGLGNVPQSYEEGQNSALALKLRGIQAQQAQTELTNAQKENEALAAPIAPQMRTIQGAPTPEMHPWQGATPNPETSQAEGGEDTTSPTQIPTGRMTPGPETQEAVKYTTPYEKAAYDMQQRAERLAQLGMGKSAFKFQQQAMEYQQMHQQQALKLASDALSFGSPSSAIPYLNSLGMGIKSIEEDPDNEDNYKVVRSANGQDFEASIPKVLATAIGNPQAGSLLASVNWRNATIANNQAKTGILQQRANTGDYRAAEMAKYHDALLEIKKRAPQAPTAVMKNAAAYMAAHPESSYGEALAVFSPKEKGQVNPTAMINALRLANKDIVANNAGDPPAPPTFKNEDKPTPTEQYNAETYQRFRDNQKMMDDMIKEVGAKAKPATPKAAGSSLVGKATSKQDGSYSINGKTVTVKGGTIISEL